jgi:hypothetical protein
MDHLSYYDPKASMKLYYRFDGAKWDRWINSRVQYINRLQHPEWLALFEDAGFECVSEELVRGSHGVERVHPCYSYLSDSDRDVNILKLVLRKPA